MNKRRKIEKNDSVLSNPFGVIASNLTDKNKENDRESLWIEKPVGFEEFVESKNFLNQKFNTVTKRGCRPRIMEIGLNVTNPDVREAIMLLGKGCISGTTEVFTSEGYKLAKDLVGNKFLVQSRDQNNFFYWNDAMCVPRGKKKTRRYTFGNGRYVDLTDNHNLDVAGKGIIRADQIKVGDFIKAPRQYLQIHNEVWNDNYFCRMLGLLLGDGCFNERRIVLTCPEIENHQWFIESLEQVRSGTSWNRQIQDTYVHYNESTFWLYEEITKLGLMCCRSKNKHVPEKIMKGTSENVKWLLSGLFSSDGWIENRNTFISIFYCSISRKLLEQTQELLLRLGIICNLNWRKKKYKGEDYWAGSVEISGHEDCLSFFEQIQTTHKNHESSYKLVKENVENGRLSMKPTDMIPKSEVKGKFRGKTGVARYNYIQKFGEDKNTIVQWIKLKSIQDLCVEETYDILCDNPSHNFIANGLSIENSGKDYLASMIHLFGIYKLLCLSDPQRYLGMAPSPIYFVNTARNDTQAKKVFFSQFKSFLFECPWFQGRFQEPGLGEVKFDKNITAMSANSQAFAWLGFNTIQWVGDEIAFFLTSDNDDESESRAGECWEAALGSCRTRFPKNYKMIGITTPRYDDDFVMKKFEELSNRPDGYTVQAATWDIHPELTIEDFKHDFERDARRTMRDYGATPQGVIESFWPNPEQINDYVCETCKGCPIYLKRKEINNINACREYEDCKANAYKGNGEWRNWFHPPQNPDQNRFFMHFDLAKSKDKLAFSLGHVIGETRVELDSYRIQQQLKLESLDGVTVDDDTKYNARPLIKIDAVGWIDIKSKDDLRMIKNGEYSYKAVEDYIIAYLLKRGFNVEKVTFDQYNSIYLKQNIEDKGIETDLISLDRTDEIPVAAKYAILERRVEYPYCLLLYTEAKYLKVINGNKIDHTKKSSKDVWDGFAGTIYNCEKSAISGGAFCGLDDDDED